MLQTTWWRSHHVPDVLADCSRDAVHRRQAHELCKLLAGRALGFFQLEMQGGIFQSCWSFTLTARGGECITGTGGEPGPLGTCAHSSTV